MMGTTDAASYAIVGIACRLPGGVRNSEELWELLLKGQDTWSCVPSDRFNEEAFYHPNLSNANGTTNHRGGHFLSDDLSLFDNEFFHIPPQQAASMDPQQRISLEVVSEALENAGLPRHSYTATKTAVYMAIFSRDYDRLLYRDPLNIPMYLTTGIGDAILANRISHALDLKGPSMTLDTGCSGGLVSVHQACTALQVGDADVAIAGSANLILGPDQQFGMTNVHMLSNDGRSYPFDERGSGYGRGEGVAAVVIKRLEDSLRDQDHIHAIIRSSAVNQDGNTAAGITRPSADAQSELQTVALAKAGLQSQDVTYVEAHGTGTKVGDETELKGLTRSYGQTRSTPLFVGSIKGNLGHTESTSGLAGLIKTVQSLQKGQIPPTILAENLKESLKEYTDKIQIVRDVTDWPKDIKRIAAVNSFGYGRSVPSSPANDLLTRLGGTNAHVILSACQPVLASPHVQPSEAQSSEKQLMVFSAASIKSLQASLSKYHKWLQSNTSNFHLADLSYTLTSRRSHHAWRFACVAGSSAELGEQLQLALNNIVIQTPALRPTQLAWVFTGQGSQWIGMATDLLISNDFPVFKDSMTQSANILSHLGARWNLEEELLKPEQESNLMSAEYAQTSTVAIQIALVDVLRSLHVRPDAVIGHSSGEIAAAYAAGHLDHMNAMKIAYCRGAIPTICRDLDLPAGAMLAVGLSESDIQPYLSSLEDRSISVACINSPQSITLSGNAASITEMARKLAEDNVFHRLLRVDLAYHSEHMRRASKKYLQNLLQHNVEDTSCGNIPFFSTVSGSRKSNGFGANYWVTNLVSPVKFQHGLEDLTHFLDSTCEPRQTRTILELGPHCALKGPIRQCGLPREGDLVRIEYVPSFQLKTGAVSSLLEMVGQLFVRSVDIDFTMLRSSCQTARVVPNLPSYAWSHEQSHWWESWLSKAYRFRQHPYHDLLGIRINEVAEPSWRHRVNFSRSPWLADHQIGGVVTFPGAAYLCMALEGARQVAIDAAYWSDACRFSLHNVKFSRTLVIPALDVDVEMQLRFTRRNRTTQQTQQYDFSIYALTTQDGWLQHCYGSVQIHNDDEEDSDTEAHHLSFVTGDSSPEKWQSHHANELYKALKKMGNTYGPTFTGITSYSSMQHHALANITIPDIAKVMPERHISAHMIHPSTLDIIMHSSLPLVASAFDNVEGAMVPTGFQELWLSPHSNLSTPNRHVETNVNLKQTFGNTAIIDLDVKDQGDPKSLLCITGIELCSLAPRSNANPSPQGSAFILNYDTDIDYISTYSSHPKEQAEHVAFSSAEQDLFASFIYQNLFKNPHASILEIGTTSTAYKTLVNDVQLQGLLPTSWMFKTVDELQEAELDRFDLIIWDDETHNIGNALDSLAILMSLLAESPAHLLLRMRHNVPPNAALSTEKHVSVTCLPDGSELDTILDQYNLQLKSRESSSGPNANTVLLLSHALQPIYSAPACEVRCLLPASSRISDFTQQLINRVATCSPSSPRDVREPLYGDSVVVIVDDAARPLLAQESEEYFDSIRSLLNLPARIVWITVSFDNSHAPYLGRHLITGVARTAHTENHNLSMITIDIHMENPVEQTMVVEHINKCICSSFRTSDKSFIEREFVYKQGRIEIPRLLKSDSLSNWVSLNTNKSSVSLSKFRGSDLRLILDVEQSMDRRHLIFQEYTSPDLLGNEIEIEVSYCIGPTLTSKLETFKPCSGVVTGVGPDVEDIHVGDEVFAIGAQTHSNRMRAIKSCVYRTQSSPLQPFNVVAIYDLMVALYALRYTCSLQPGETVLIDGPIDSTMRMVAAVANHLKAWVLIATHDDADYQDLTRNRQSAAYTILPPGVRNSTRKMQDFLHDEKISAILTNDSNPSDVLLGSLQPFGSLILLPGRDIKGSASLLISENAPESINISRCNLSALLVARKELAGSLMKEALLFAQTSNLLETQKPCIQTWTQYEKEVFSKSPKVQVGEVAISCNSTRAVLVKTLRSENEQSLNPNSTYLIAGGLGDIGRRLIRLMTKLGAQNFVTLSRNIPSPDLIQETQDYVAAFSPRCRVVPLKCDIAQKDTVHDARRQVAELGLPPVRGIIQSAAVLRDEPLESMKLGKFQAAVQPKYLGTVNLEEAFGTQGLDFFIMLASAANIVGTGAQSNYNAGNAVLDGLAYEKLGSQCQYHSLSLGFLEESRALHGNTTRLSALQRQGLVPMEEHEMEKLFTFSFRRASDLQSHTHRVIGLGTDPTSKSSIINGNNNSPMFVHVRQSTEEKADVVISEEESSLPFCDLSDKEKLQFITTKLCRKLALMVSFQTRELAAQEILLNIGMDSLMAIELRNWIAHEFQTIFQSSELLHHISIGELAGKILDRQAPAVSAELESSSNNSDLESLVSNAATPRTSASVAETMPSLPLPDLDFSLSQLLDSRRLFCSDSEMQELSEAVASFKEDIGAALQDKLGKLYPTPELQDQISDAIYLQPRTAIPDNSAFFFNHKNFGKKHSQAQRCAIISLAALQFRDLSSTGNLKFDYLGDTLLDADTYNWLFHAARVPEETKDRLTQGDANPNIVVLNNGHIYLLKILPVTSRLQQISALTAQFQYIQDNSKSPIPSVAMLTGKDRNVWAHLREELITHEPRNQHLLEIVSNAAFVVCMDSTVPQSPAERCNSIWAATPENHNRWWDKTLQLVVTQDGSSGMIGEHSRTDGMTHRPLLEHLQAAINEYDVSNTLASTTGEVIPEESERNPKELLFNLPLIVTDHIRNMNSTTGLSNITPVDHTELRIQDMGRSTFWNAHYPAKACALLTILLAITLWNRGENPVPMWEIVSQAVYRHGRIDWVQLIDEPVWKFVQAACLSIDGGIDQPALQALWQSAVHANTKNITTAKQGHGFVRHLHALKLMLQPEDPLPKLFTTRSWATTVRGGLDQSIKIDALPPGKGPYGQWTEGGFMMHGQNSCLLHYHFEEEDNCLFISAQTAEGHSGKLFDCIRQSVELVKSLL